MEEKKKEIIDEPKMVELKPSQSITDNSKLDEILARQDALETANKAKDIELDLLRKSVSTAKYNFEKEKMDKDRIPTVRFKLWKGVPIVAMKSIEQKLNRSPLTGQIVSENIRYMFKMIDGTEQEIPYVDFYTIIDHAIAHVVSRRTDHKVEMYDGKVHDHEDIYTCEFIDEELKSKYKQFDVPIPYINL